MKILRCCDIIIAGLLIAVVCGVQLSFDVRMHSVFDLGKVCVLVYVALGIIGVWLIRIIYAGRFEFPDTPLNMPILAFVGFAIVATIFSINPIMSLMGGYKRYEGLIETSAYVLIFFAVVAFVNTGRKFSIVIHSIVFTSAFTAFYGFLQYFGHDPFMWSSANPERIFSSYGNPVFFSAFLIMTLPLSFALFLGCGITIGRPAAAVDSGRYGAGLRRLKEIGYGVCTLLIYTIFWHTKTRADFVGLVVLLPLFVIFLGRERLRIHRVKLIIMLTLFVAIGGFYNMRAESSMSRKFAGEIKIGGDARVNVAGDTNADDRSAIANMLSGSSFNRYYQYKTALKVFNDYPILGIGPDTLGIVYQRYLDKVFTRRKEDGHWPRHDRVHNDVLENALARGSLGLVTYIWIVLAYFWLIWKCLRRDAAGRGMQSSMDTENTRDGAAFAGRQFPIDTRLMVVCLGAGVIGYLVQNEFSFGNTAIVPLFWTLIALTIVVANQPRSPLSPLPSPLNSQLSTRNSQLAARAPLPALRNALLSMLVVITIAFITIQMRSWFRADIYMEMGRKLCGINDFENGLASYDQAILRNPYEVNYLDYLNNALFTLYNTSKERVWLENIAKIATRGLTIIPDHFLGFYALGNVHYILAQDYGEDTLDTAIRYYAKAIESDPFQPEFHSHIGLAFIRKGMFAEAAEAMEKALIISPNNTGYVEKLSVVYIQLERYDAAERLYNEYPAISSVAFHNAKGVFLAKNGKNDEAMLEFRKSLALNPDDVTSLENVMKLSILKGGLTGEVIGFLERLITLQPSNAQHRLRLAETYAASKMFPESIEQYLHAVKMVDQPTQAALFGNVAKIYMAQGDYDNAIVNFRNAINLDPSNAQIHNNLGTAYVQKRLYVDAAAEIENALMVEPDNTTFLSNKAKVYIIQERLSDAEDVLKKIITLDRDNAESVKMLEAVRAKMGRALP